jgi:hypothetical protein
MVNLLTLNWVANTSSPGNRWSATHSRRWMRSRKALAIWR